jgi:rare lipoprotein A
MGRGQVIRADRLAAVLLAGAALTACATPQYAVRGTAAHAPSPYARSQGGPSGYKTGEPYQVGGIWYVPHEQPNYDETGIASWYGEAFQLKATADGEIFDMNQFSAAHTTLPLPSMVEVTNLDNGRKLTVRVNDRGPFVGGRIIDLSQAAARELGYDRLGLARVRVRYVGPAPLAPPDAGLRYARVTPPAAPPAITQVATRRPADEDIFAEAPARGLQVVVKPAVPPPEPVYVSSLAPLPAAAARPAMAGEAGFRIQAGAYSDEANARRAADQLSAEGVATVEPFQRSGETLYRVLLPGPSDEAQAYALRDKLARIGFTDARVVRPF